MLEYLDGYCNSFKIKYLYLDKLFHGKLESANKKDKREIDTANIYINFESIYNGLRTPYVEKRLAKCTKKELKQIYRQAISSFINIAAHYREYFKRHKIKTNIIFYYNEITEQYENYNNTALCEDYRMHFYNSLHNYRKIVVNGMIDDCIQFMKILVEYIENAYMVSSKRVESSLIPFVLEMEGALPSNINIFITKDMYDFQYCNYHGIIIKKHNDTPILLTKRNIMKYMCLSHDFEPEKFINPLLITFILSCIGDRKRSLPKIKGFGFKTIYKGLLSLYEAGYLFDENEDTFGIQNLISVLNQNDLIKRDIQSIGTDIMSNYRCIDLESQFRVLNKAQKNKITDQIVDKTDSGSLLEINERYFEECPIMLIELNQYKKNAITGFK